MPIDRDHVSACLAECKKHFTTELLPFWLDRCKDDVNGGFITQFDKDGNDTGQDEKSSLAQLRTVYSMSTTHRAGFGDGRCAEATEANPLQTVGYRIQGISQDHAGNERQQDFLQHQNDEDEENGDRRPKQNLALLSCLRSHRPSVPSESNGGWLELALGCASTIAAHMPQPGTNVGHQGYNGERRRQPDEDRSHVPEPQCEAGVSEHGRISHGIPEDGDCHSWWTEPNSWVQRSVFMEEFVYTVAPDRINVAHMDDLSSLIASADLPL